MGKRAKEARQQRKIERETDLITREVPPKVQHVTVEDANKALSETARVINMKERTAAMNKEKTKKASSKAAAATAKAPKAPKVRADGLPELPGLPKTKYAAKAKPLVPCQCGCGGTTKGRFAPGHDSYFRGIIARLDKKVMTLDDLERIGEAQREGLGKGQREAAEKFLVERKKAERAAAREAKTETATGTDE